MRTKINEIYNVLTAFSSTTGVGAVFYDSEKKIIASKPTKELANDFLFLGADVITAFLEDKFSSHPFGTAVFYTYFLDADMLCNLVVIRADTGAVGAFVTQPFLFRKATREEFEARVSRLNPSARNADHVRRVLSQLPVVRFNSIMPMGETLLSLAETYFLKRGISQIIVGNRDAVTKPDRDTTPAEVLLKKEPPPPVRQMRLSVFMQMKDAIQNGDTDALFEVVNSLSVRDVPIHQLDDTDLIRSVKNSFIRLISFACFAAIEGGAPYYRVLDMCDALIRRAEKTPGIMDLFEVLKDGLEQITNAVSVSRITGYSKPIRQVMDYIHTNYNEKITLETLAELTGLSTFYLSSRIKKETGQSLTDAVNTARVEAGKKLLLEENTNIIDVAQRVGFGYQNHFSTVFKKVTGMTPTEYMKSMGQGVRGPQKLKKQHTFAPPFIEQLRHNLLVFSKVFDVARVVDPITRISWPVSDSDNEYPETCYEFWNNNTSCANCVSASAFLHDRSYFKLEQKGARMFFVLAFPKTVDDKTYVVELLRDVTDSSLLNVPPGYFCDASLEYPVRTIPASLQEMFDRKTVDEQLPVCMRRSQLEGYPFTVVLLTVVGLGELEAIPGARADLMLFELVKLIETEIRVQRAWTGLYTGDLVLVAFENADLKTAEAVAERVQREFGERTIKAGTDTVTLKAVYAATAAPPDGTVFGGTPCKTGTRIATRRVGEGLTKGTQKNTVDGTMIYNHRSGHGVFLYYSILLHPDCRHRRAYSRWFCSSTPVCVACYFPFAFPGPVWFSGRSPWRVFGEVRCGCGIPPSTARANHKEARG